MIRKLSVLAAGIALAHTVSPVFADTSSVDQTGNYNTATVEQIASPANNNSSIINQGMGGGANYNTASVLQNNNTSYAGAQIYQWMGDSNVASIQQTSSTAVRAYIQEAGTGNTSSIVQSGASGGPVRGESYAGIIYIGNSNNASVYQHDGSDLYAGINLGGAYGVGGDYNTASIDQTGTNQVADIKMDHGDYNTAGIVQTGGNNVGNIQISGGNSNVASILQTSFGNTASITQVGSGNLAYTTQASLLGGSSSVVSQTGNGNVSNVFQH